MCGIVGLHLKNHDLQSRLGELLAIMLEAMTTRGPDSAGLAIYADDDTGGNRDGPCSTRCAPARQSTGTGWPGNSPRNSVVTAGPDRARPVRAGPVPAATGGASTVTARRLAGDSAVLTPAADESVFLGALRRMRRPSRWPATAGRCWSSRTSALPAAICARYGIPGWAGYQGDRPHQDGDGVGGDHRPLAPVRPRRGPRARPQRVVLELRNRPPQARPVGRPLRDRQRLRGRRPAGRTPHGRRARASTTPSGT